MLITEETKKAINNGILTDDQLKEALAHYSLLEKMLYLHGEIYQLVWVDVVNKLDTLRGVLYARNGTMKLGFDRDGKEYE